MCHIRNHEKLESSLSTRIWTDGTSCICLCDKCFQGGFRLLCTGGGEYNCSSLDQAILVGGSEERREKDSVSFLVGSVTVLELLVPGFFWTNTD